jgi:tetratricopeptide (TPR) repeat protein
MSLMAIGFLPRYRFSVLTGLMALTLGFCVLQSIADDQLIKKDGTKITGQVMGVSGGQVTVSIHSPNGGIAKVPYYLSDIQSVTMTPPAGMAAAQGAAPTAVITTLEPLIKQFAGLPTDWVVEAMGQLAQAYDAQGQTDHALELYNQIDSLYPGSKYHLEAAAGKAMVSLKQGKIDEALVEIQPIVDQANKNLVPSPEEGRLYANAFLVYGQVLQAQKKLPQALEAFLTVKTMFYQNPTLVEQADQFAGKLRDENPGLGVD